MANRIRTFLFALGFMAVGAGSTVAMNAAARGGYGHGPGFGFQEVVQDLDLTQEQQAALDDLRDDFRDFRDDRRDGRDGHMGRMMELLTQDQVDRKAVHKQLDADAAERLAAAHELVDRVLDFRDTLSPEQRAKLAEHLHEMRQRRDEFRQGQGQGYRGSRDDE